MTSPESVPGESGPNAPVATEEIAEAAPARPEPGAYDHPDYAWLARRLYVYHVVSDRISPIRRKRRSTPSSCRSRRRSPGKSWMSRDG